MGIIGGAYIARPYTSDTCTLVVGNLCAITLHPRVNTHRLPFKTQTCDNSPARAIGKSITGISTVPLKLGLNEQTSRISTGNDVGAAAPILRPTRTERSIPFCDMAGNAARMNIKNKIRVRFIGYLSLNETSTLSTLSRLPKAPSKEAPPALDEKTMARLY